MELRVARGSGPTGRILTDLMRQRGLLRNDGAIVSYGVPVQGTRVLNGNAGRLDKYEQGLRMAERGVSVIPHWNPAHAREVFGQHHHALLGRTRNHVGGKDIMLCLQREDIDLRVRAGAQFFTPYIPSRTEYRVYVYRGRHLGTYEKVLRYPSRYRKVGRNYDNGFAFQLVNSAIVPRPAVELAVGAVAGLDLDFGAVDILAGTDGRYYVLEVNTAPGLESGNRQVAQGLVEHFGRWAEGGYRARNGSEEATSRRASRAVAVLPRPARPLRRRPDYTAPWR